MCLGECLRGGQCFNLPLCGRRLTQTREALEKNWTMRTVVFAVPIVLFVTALLIKVGHPDVYLLSIQEDSAIEYAQFVFYFVAAALSAFLSVRFIKVKLPLYGTLYCLLAIGLLFVSFEEISWGQRIFNIPNPPYFQENNSQKEISIHNLKSIQPKLHRLYILVGAYGAFTWVFARRYLSRASVKIKNLIKFVVPDWFISSYFFFVFFVYVVFEFVSKPRRVGFLLWRDQEPAELLLSLGFLAFVVSSNLKLKVFLRSK
jgi:hypothetical protein